MRHNFCKHCIQENDLTIKFCYFQCHKSIVPGRSSMQLVSTMKLYSWEVQGIDIVSLFTVSSNHECCCHKWHVFMTLDVNTKNIHAYFIWYLCWLQSWQIIYTPQKPPSVFEVLCKCILIKELVSDWKGNLTKLYPSSGT